MPRPRTVTRGNPLLLLLARIHRFILPWASLLLFLRVVWLYLDVFMIAISFTAKSTSTSATNSWNEVAYTAPADPLASSSPIRFVLFLGLEGTGHHFWQDLIKASPIHPVLKELQLHPQYTEQLTGGLYRHKKERHKGLWSSICKWNPQDPSPNVTDIQRDLIHILQNMTQHVQQERKNRLQPTATAIATTFPILFPINLLASGDEVGVISYPGFLKPCRSVNYPNLHVWYQACQQANVLCQHVYLYREPYSVIKSTTVNRPINGEKLEAIHLYTTQLHLIHSQLLQFPEKTVGCWNYDAITSSQHFREQIQPLLPFASETAYQTVIKQTFLSRSPLEESQKQALVPTELQPYMHSFIRMHDTVVQTCHRAKQISK